MTSRPFSLILPGGNTDVGIGYLIFVSSAFYYILGIQETVFKNPESFLLGNGVDGGDEQALQQTYSPKGSASCVQSFDDSLVLQFA